MLAAAAPLARARSVRANGLELSGVAAETTCPAIAKATANEEHTLKDSRQPRPLQRLVGRLPRLPPYRRYDTMGAIDASNQLPIRILKVRRF